MTTGQYSNKVGVYKPILNCPPYLKSQNKPVDVFAQVKPC